jgi:hypothetical protein
MKSFVGEREYIIREEGVTAIVPSQKGDDMTQPSLRVYE